MALRKISFIALILTLAIPVSAGDHAERSRRSENIEQFLKDLCSETEKSNECWNILKSELNRFTSSDERTIAGDAADLAIAKSKEIYDELYQYHLDSEDEGLKKKYLLCAKNYYDANCNLVLARRNLDFDENPNISNEVSDAEEELNNCEHEFEEELFDPARVGDRNEELGLYLGIVRAASARLPSDVDGEVSY